MKRSNFEDYDPQMPFNRRFWWWWRAVVVGVDSVGGPLLAADSGAQAGGHSAGRHGENGLEQVDDAGPDAESIVTGAVIGHAFIGREIVIPAQFCTADNVFPEVIADREGIGQELIFLRGSPTGVSPGDIEGTRCPFCVFNPVGKGEPIGRIINQIDSVRVRPIGFAAGESAAGAVANMVITERPGKALHRQRHRQAEIDAGRVGA